MDAALLVAIAVMFGATLGAFILYMAIRIQLAEFNERLMQAERMSLEFRIATIRIGEKLDHERRKYVRMATNLVGVIKCLLDCIDHPENVRDINRPAITRMVQSILDDSSETYMGM